VKSARHEWIVFDRVRKTHELGTSEPSFVASEFCRLLYQPANLRDNVHVDAGARRCRVDRSGAVVSEIAPQALENELRRIAPAEILASEPCQSGRGSGPPDRPR